VIGQTLGPYQILAKLGEGGMGEVYRARDTLLKRDVAIKVLPLAFAGDPERIARFQREAEVLATLNHPNIAAIHGLQDSDSVRSLVLEFVDGPTLADLIGGRPMPLDNVLAIARQIADALEAAHERGIIHRDLKPANVKVRPDGTVKVLDFGLAKALEARSPQEGVKFGVSQSPTITSPAMTRVGVVLGTAAYMSPEQARGHDADERSDLWAFGCVLFEMLTGRRAFEGDEVSDTLAAVLRAEPDQKALPAATPASVRRLLRRCLEKNPKRRLADIRDARLELDESSAEPLAETPRVGMRSPWRERIAWSLAVVGLVAAIAAAARLWQRETPSVPTAQFAILPPNGTALAPDADTVAVAPDGRSLVFAAGGSDAPWQLWLRSIDGLRGRAPALLVRRRQVHRLLCRWQIETRGCWRRTGSHTRRCGRESPTGRNVEQRGDHPFRPRLRTTHCAHPRQWRRIDRGHDVEGRRIAGTQRPLLPSGRSSLPLLGVDWSQHTCRLLRFSRRG
jgi:hypothetical protein